MDNLEAETLVRDLWAEWQETHDKSEKWQDWALGKQPLPVIPDTATAEYEQLQRLAVTPWLGLLVQALTQSLDVEGYTRSDTDETDPEGPRLWNVWQANRMDSKQVSLYEAALTTGISYVAVLPTSAARNPRQDTLPEWRPYSSSRMCAFYEHPDDEWPKYALLAEAVPKWQLTQREVGGHIISLFDSTHVYHLRQSQTQDHPYDPTKPSLAFIDAVPHGAPTTPIVRYVNRQTISGRVIGEIEPYTAPASRIDQDVFDRLIVQRFGAWRVRYATGLVNPLTDENSGLSEEERTAAAHAQEVQLRLNSVLTSDSPDSKFGTLDQTDLTGHLQAPIDSIRMLASVSQTPPQVFTGDISNISAEALAALDASYNRKVEQRKQSFGESHEQAFDLTARLIGVEPDANAQVRWRDMESRSMSQTADAYGKLAQMLEIPVEVLWDKIGILTEQDRTRAKEIRDRSANIGDMLLDAALGAPDAQPAI